MVALLIAAALAAAVPVEPSPYFLDASTVVQVECNHGSGTAFYVGNNLFVTAKHVALDETGANAECKIAGVRARLVEYGHGFLDYAVFELPLKMHYRAIISCEGFKEGRTYYATGYAEGNPWLVTQRLIGSNYQFHAQAPFNKTTMMRGGATQGQSGGPVSNEDGLVVGIVSHGATAGVTEQLFLSLSDTPLCTRNPK